MKSKYVLLYFYNFRCLFLADLPNDFYCYVVYYKSLHKKSTRVTCTHSSQLPAAHSHSIDNDIRNFVYYICMQGQPEITLQRF